MQTTLFPMKTKTDFGGIHSRGKRKSARPLCTKRTIHLVMKASSRVKFRKNRLVQSEIELAARKWGVRVYRLAIESDHLHLLIRIPTRMAYRFFIQRISGAIALKLQMRWLMRPFTRIVGWGREFRRVRTYIEMNELEALGFIARQPRGRGAMKERFSDS